MTTRKIGKKSRHGRTASKANPKPKPKTKPNTNASAPPRATVAGAPSPYGAGAPTLPFPQNALAVAALCLLVAVCFFPATQAGFVWDDSVLLKAWPVQTPSGLRQIWFEPRTIAKEAHYWPVLYTTFWLEHQLWELNPRGYHIVNLLLHLAVTLLLWRLMRRLGVPGAWLVAAVFAVHPTHVESAAWVIGRKDLLASLFYLASALAWLRFTENRQHRYYAVALALFVLALLSKTIAVTLPVALLIWHWWKHGRITRTDAARVAPFLLVGLAILTADWLYYGSVDAVVLHYSPLERVLMAAQSLWFYALNLLWPANLAVIYPHFDLRATNPLAWAALFGAVAVLVGLWVARHRIGRAPLAAVLFFAVTLTPVLGFVDYGYMQFSFVADRYQYLAGAGIIALGVGAAAHAARRLPDAWRTATRALAVVPLAALGALTWQQAGIYRDNITFYSHVAALNPSARLVHFSLGHEYHTQGRHDEALAAYRTEQRFARAQRPPDHARLLKVNLGLGAIAELQGRLEEAEAHYRNSIVHPDSFRRLSAMLLKQQRGDEALALYQSFIEANPRSARLQFEVGGILLELNRPADALRRFERALELDPYMKKARSGGERARALLNNKAE